MAVEVTGLRIGQRIVPVALFKDNGNLDIQGVSYSKTFTAIVGDKRIMFDGRTMIFALLAINPSLMEEPKQ